MTSKEAIEYLKGVGYQASAFSRFEPYYEDGTSYKEAVDVIEAELKKAEPVKHGKWIEDYNNTYRKRKVKCSVCGKYSGIGGIIENQNKPYCPNCGAKMYLGEEE